MIYVYGLKNCDSCRKALKWFAEQGIEVDFIDYRASPIEPTLLLAWQEQLGGWAKLVNRASPTWRNLPEQRKTPDSDQDWLQLIAENPTLVRRPVVVTSDDVSVGFKESLFSQRFIP